MHNDDWFDELMLDCPQHAPETPPAAPGTTEDPILEYLVQEHGLRIIHEAEGYAWFFMHPPAYTPSGRLTNPMPEHQCGFATEHAAAMAALETVFTELRCVAAMLDDIKELDLLNEVALQSGGLFLTEQKETKTYGYHWGDGDSAWQGFPSKASAVRAALRQLRYIFAEHDIPMPTPPRAGHAHA